MLTCSSEYSRKKVDCNAHFASEWSGCKRCVALTLYTLHEIILLSTRYLATIFAIQKRLQLLSLVHDVL
jgi:hypothetical protein